MMITLDNVGKRYNSNWIFKNLSASFQKGQHYAITGANGSGKSTLILLLAGQHAPQQGTMQVQLNGKWVAPDSNWFNQYSIAAPYVELIEELTLLEMLEFHFKMQPMLPGITPMQLMQLIDLQQIRNRPIRNFSSGMKQKTKLALAILSNAPILLLDEPGSNLDTTAFALYQQLLQTYANHKLVIIASNNEQEISHCTNRINIMDYKMNAVKD